MGITFSRCKLPKTKSSASNQGPYASGNANQTDDASSGGHVNPNGPNNQALPSDVPNSHVQLDQNKQSDSPKGLKRQPTGFVRGAPEDLGTSPSASAAYSTSATSSGRVPAKSSMRSPGSPRNGPGAKRVRIVEAGVAPS